jgi:thioesterase domain-containing protein/acyl carrier protein
MEKATIASANKSEFRQLSPAELAFQHNLSQGILPNEGTSALFKVLHHCHNPQVIISSLAIEGLTEEVEASARALHQTTEVTKFARPELDNDYQAPSDDIERTLVGFWEELLGVDRVGTLDNFFDLGGHSLVAVRLFAKIQHAYNLEFPISVLFEAPTIFACAAMIREAIGSHAEHHDRGEESQDSPRRSRYLHLVPMHATKSSQLTPFFLVAGMFGNVLNLRHLAQLIGTERPFFGLQARGLFGDHAPHSTFEEMARDYIAEMLTVQPTGPFILGGFSGGGITAYEISRQLMELGHDVAELIFLDTPLPYNDPLSSLDRMSIHWQRLKTQGIAYFTQWAKNRYHWELEKYQKRFESSGDLSQSPNESKSGEFKSGVMELAFYQALTQYQIEPLKVKATLFRPKLPVEYYLSGDRMARHDRQIIMPDNGWPRYIEDLQVFEVPGDHDSMVLEPNVRILAAQLRKTIDAADPLRKRTARDLRPIDSPSIDLRPVDSHSIDSQPIDIR